MSTNPRETSVKLTAEAREFYTGLHQAAERLRQFGREGALAARPISDEFRALGREGAAAGGAVVELKGKMLDFYRSIAEAPERIAAGWRSMNSAIRATRDELRAFDAQASSTGDKLVKRFEAIGAIGAAVAGIGTAIGRFVAGAGADAQVVGGNASAFENFLNLARTARLILAPTIFTAATVAVGALVEEIGRLTVAQGEANEKDALFARAHDASIEKTQQLSAVVKRLGGDLGTFLAALNAYEAANPGAGLPEFGAALEKLGNIRDPVERVKATLDGFGNDVGTRLLPFLDERFRVNAERVANWGVSLDKTARENIDTFRKDMHDFALGFKEDADFIGLAARKMGLEVESGFAGLYVAIRTRVDESTLLIDGLINKLDEITSKKLPAGGLLPPDKLDVGAISKRFLSSSEQGFTNSVLESMAPSLAGLRTALQKELDSRDRARFQGILDRNLPLLFPQTEEETKASKELAPDQLALIREQTLSAKTRLDALAAPKREPVSDPFGKSIREQEAAIDGLTAKLATIGKSDSAKLMAEAFAEARKRIEEVNEELARMHKEDARVPAKLNAGQEAQERAKATSIVQLQAETEWQTKFQAGTVSIGDRIKSLELMTAAIGKGYEATRNANAEAKLMQEFGAHYWDKEWLGQGDSATGVSHQAQLDARRTQLRAEQDEEQNQTSGETLNNLVRRIALEKDLAQAELQGAEAVRKAAFEAKLRDLQSKLGTEEYKKQEAAERELYALERDTANATALAGLSLKIQATERMTAAILQSAAAERQAAIETRVAEAVRAGANEEQIAAIRKEGADEYAQQLARASVEADRTRAIADQIQKLKDAKALYGDTLAIEIQLRDLENERIKALVQESLGLRGARDGVRAFFLEMQEDSASAAKIVYDNLNSTLDRVSENLAKLFTGQKTNWAKSFKEEGEKMVEASTKSLLQTGLGKLGKVLGVDIGAGKPDGSSANPFWVRMATAAPGAGVSGGGLAPGIIGVPSGVFQGGGGLIQSLLKRFVGGGSSGSSGTFDPSSLANWGGWEAEGGGVDPGQVYGVGEAGPELFVPQTAGRIVPNGGLGGETHIHYNIDARGADLGAHNRIMRAIEASHKSAVATAVQAVHERAQRTVRR